MTTWRKLVLALGCLVIAALCAYPKRVHTISGHGEILHHVRIDWEPLALKCGAVAYLTGAVVLVLPGARRKDGSGDP